MAERPCAIRASGLNDAYTLPELRDMARSRGIPYSGKSKRALCAALDMQVPERDLIPCMGWTLEELRDAARRRGISVHRKTKADLCKDLQDLEPMMKPAENPVSVDPPYIRVPGGNRSVDFQSFVDCPGRVVRRHSKSMFPKGFRLRPHQARTVERILDPGTRGLLLFFGMGSGKTFASLCAAEALMECGAVKGVVAVMPAGLISNYKKEMAAAGATASRYSIMSYEAATRNAPSTKDMLLVLDEAHNVKNPDGKCYSAIKMLGNRASKVLLLTGTPVQNYPYEICTIMNIIEDDVLPPNRQLFEQNFGREGLEGGQELLDEISRHVVYYTPPQTSADYPRLETYEYFVPMAPEQQDLHYRAVNKTRKPIGSIADGLQDGTFNMSFFMDPRKIANAVKVHGRWVCPKLDYIASNVALAARRGEKSVVYSFFVDRGSSILKDLLDKRGVKSAVISGRQSQESRTYSVRRYNADLLTVLIISEAGSEGLDLKHTRHVHITEPSWNEEITSQAIGRARRYKSHTRADVEPLVQVHRYYAVLPGEQNIPQRAKTIQNTGADSIIRYISRDKNEACKAFLGEVIRGSFENFKELDIYEEGSEDDVSGHRTSTTADTRPAFMVRSNTASKMCFYVAAAESMYGRMPESTAAIRAAEMRAKAALHVDDMDLEERGFNPREVKARIGDEGKAARWVDMNVVADMLDVNMCVLIPRGEVPPLDTWIDKTEFQDLVDRCTLSCTEATSSTNKKLYILLNKRARTYHGIVFV